MKIILYNNLEDLQNAAKLNNVEVYETDFMYSFRIFENYNTKEFHEFKKL